MGSLYSKMYAKGGKSYGTVPGNGGPRADDKIMNVGEGHVVPAENAHVAKKLVADMGYDPNAKVNMNQANGKGVDIKISSQEFFMNKDQVDGLKQKGINPELLSPNSPYNRTEEGMNAGGSLYNKMNPYQNGGGIEPYQRPDLAQYPYQQTVEQNGQQIPTWYDQQGRAVYSEVGNAQRMDNTQQTSDYWDYVAESGYTPELDINNLPPGVANPDYAPSAAPNVAQAPVAEGITNLPEVTASAKGIPGNMGGLQTRPAQPVDTGMTPLSERQPEPMTSAEGLTIPKATADQNASGISPEDQHLQDLIDRSEKLTNQEKIANAAMFGHNAMKKYEDLPMPTRRPPSLINRDFESIKNDMREEIGRNERRGTYQMKQLGMDPTNLVGVTANTQQNTLKGLRSIWDMQQQDIAGNVQRENAYNADYDRRMDATKVMNAQSAAQFQQAKGENMAGNVREYFGAEEAGLYRTGELQGYEVNKKMDDLDASYDALDKNKMLQEDGPGYKSREDYRKMSDAERTALQESLKK